MNTWLRRLLAVAAVGWVAYALAVWAPSAAIGDPSPIYDGAAIAKLAPPPALIPPTYAGHDAQWWHGRYLAQLHRTRALKRTILRQPSVTEALNLACTVYGNCATLWRRAKCETGGTYSPTSANRHSSARGLLQFLTKGRIHRFGDHVLVDGGTWATTPFWHFNVFSPYANALAAGWMIDHGRGGEWACR